MKLNKKGFTLIELLATIVILAIVMSITAVVSLDVYNASKIKSEKVFIEKINKLIDDYIALEGSNYTKTSTKTTFQKCTTKAGETETCKNYHAYLMKDKDEVVKIPFNVLITEKLINEEDFVNPYDKTKCYINNENEKNYFAIYKDEDSVFYFKYRLQCIKNADNKYDSTWVYSNIPS